MAYDLGTTAGALALLAVLVLVGIGIRRWVPLVRRLFIPNAVTAGVLGLLLGPEVLGRLTGDDGQWADGLFSDEVIAIWRELPGMLINVVFAAILLGKAVPNLRTIWDESAGQALFGATLSFGQYAVGLLLAILVLEPIFDLSELSGGLLEISFTGGHGTAAGLSGVMTELGFEEGTDLALGLATVGLLAGIVVGTFLTNRAVRSENIVIAREQEVDPGEGDLDIALLDTREIPEPFEPDPATSPLTVMIGVITLAIGAGWAIQRLLIGVEILLTSSSADDAFLAEIPLFPFTILGGALVQVVIVARGWGHLVPRSLVNQTAGVALDLLIAAAIATVSLSTLGDNVGPFVLMAVVALGWSVLALVVLAPRFYGTRWFERGIGDFGQSSGTVASGFLLIDMSDPDAISGARDSYGYKQLLFEPFLGGGLVTALSLPLIDRVGAVPALIGATLATLACILGGVRIRRAAT